jgi:mannose-6-phosphate isomerase-like protein (cupin superfamily)
MIKTFLPALTCLIFFTAKAQKNGQSLDTIKPPAAYENSYVRSLYTDSATVSGFVIFIKKEVKLHKHVEHTEQVLILDGEAIMNLGEREFKVKKGDMILIPKNTFHSVKTTSKKPLKVLSIQAPYFDGKDRVYKE